jgi:uncharacterized membrane protein
MTTLLNESAPAALALARFGGGGRGGSIFQLLIGLAVFGAVAWMYTRPSGSGTARKS